MVTPISFRPMSRHNKYLNIHATSDSPVRLILRNFQASLLESSTIFPTSYSYRIKSAFTTRPKVFPHFSPFFQRFSPGHRCLQRASQDQYFSVFKDIAQVRSVENKKERQPLDHLPNVVILDTRPLPFSFPHRVGEGGGWGSRAGRPESLGYLSSALNFG